MSENFSQKEENTVLYFVTDLNNPFKENSTDTDFLEQLWARNKEPQQILSSPQPKINKICSYVFRWKIAGVGGNARLGSESLD